MPRIASINPFQILFDEDRIHFEGQIMHLSGISENVSQEDSFWKNIKRTFHFYTPKKINLKNRQLRVEINNVNYFVDLDKYGYFNYDGNLNGLGIKNIKRVRFFLGESRIYLNNAVDFRSFLVDKRKKLKGVISDIDDTVMVSHSTNKLKKSATLGLKNATTRKIVSSTKEFIEEYSKKDYHFFYVSNSETNLYLLIKWFIKSNNLPDGPIFLKKLRSYRNLFIFNKSRSFFRKQDHKIKRIEYILNNYPMEKFVLIGDSSQDDPEVYYFICQKYSQKIERVLIRDITNQNRRKDLKAMQGELEKLSIEMTIYQ